MNAERKPALVVWVPVASFVVLLLVQTVYITRMITTMDARISAQESESVRLEKMHGANQGVRVAVLESLARHDQRLESLEDAHAPGGRYAETINELKNSRTTNAKLLQELHSHMEELIRAVNNGNVGGR